MIKSLIKFLIQKTMQRHLTWQKNIMKMVHLIEVNLNIFFFIFLKNFIFEKLVKLTICCPKNFIFLIFQSLYFELQPQMA